MDKYTLQGIKNNYYKKGYEDALLLVLNLVKRDEGDLDKVIWDINNILNNED